MSAPCSFSLRNCGALVTGSTQGIGKAMADALEGAGARVIRHGIKPEGGGALSHDLLDRASPEKLMEAAFDIDPALNILVCNAGGFFDTDYLAMDADRLEKTFRLNVEQAYFLVQAFAKGLVAGNRTGSVVLTSSTSGYFAERGSTAYDTSKGATVMMTRTLALELAPHGIRVNGIAPGLIRTPLTAGWMDQDPVATGKIERRIPAGRIGTPEDCGGACVFLCSPAAAYVAGHVLVIDGGRTLGQIGHPAD